MGAQNVAAAYARWGALSHAPFRALVYMALRSLDADQPPRFWGGRDEIALALGRRIPPEGKEFDKERKANWEMAKKVTGELVKAGAIRLLRAGKPGSNAVYALNLDVFGAGCPQGSPQADGGNSLPPSGGNPVPPESGDGGNPGPPIETDGGNPGPPRGGEPLTEDPPLGTRSRIDGFGEPAPAPAREDPKPEEETEEEAATKNVHDFPASNSDCPGCGALLDPDGSCFVCRTPTRKGIPA